MLIRKQKLPFWMVFDKIKESPTNVVKTSYGLLIYRCALIVSRDEESCLLSGGFGKPESYEGGWLNEIKSL